MQKYLKSAGSRSQPLLRHIQKKKNLNLNQLAVAHSLLLSTKWLIKSLRVTMPMNTPESSVTGIKF